MKPHYKTLGVKETAGETELKDRYRILSKKYHPDRNPGDKEAEEKFKAIASAYEILSDPERRKIYDLTGSDDTEAARDTRAGTLLQQLFQTVVSQKGLAEVINIDMITLVNDALDRGFIKLNENITTARDSRKAIGKILKKLKHKNKNNPIAGMLKQEIAKHTETIEKSKLNIDTGKRAQKMWKEYGFDYEQQIKVNYRSTFGLNMQTTSNMFSTGVMS